MRIKSNESVYVKLKALTFARKVTKQTDTDSGVLMICTDSGNQLWQTKW